MWLVLVRDEQVDREWALSGLLDELLSATTEEARPQFNGELGETPSPYSPAQCWQYATQQDAEVVVAWLTTVGYDARAVEVP